MNPDIKTRWVSALRSGDYPQGRLNLNDDGQFCCLGVLCELAVEDGVIGKKVFQDRSVSYVHIDGGEEDSALPPGDVVRWSALETRNPYVTVSDDIVNSHSEVAENIDSSNRMSLAGLNDSGVPFKVIAQLVEDQL